MVAGALDVEGLAGADVGVEVGGAAAGGGFAQDADAPVGGVGGVGAQGVLAGVSAGVYVDVGAGLPGGEGFPVGVGEFDAQDAVGLPGHAVDEQVEPGFLGGCHDGLPPCPEVSVAVAGSLTGGVNGVFIGPSAVRSISTRVGPGRRWPP